MHTIVARRTYVVSKDLLWKQLGNFDDMSWHPSIAQCDATTLSLGRTRKLKFLDGRCAQDKLLEIGPWHYRCRRLRSASQEHQHISELRIHSTRTGGCSLEWTAIYDAMSRPTAIAKDRLEAWMHQGLYAVSGEWVPTS
ncbi:MAG: hypothetical protein ACI9MC_003875 [Kiritimatiellia bacterium]|jgi:hypothetical protein